MRIQSGQSGSTLDLLRNDLAKPAFRLTEPQSKRLQEAKEALAKLEAARVDLPKQLKAAAAQRVESLKRELRTLRMMAAVGDPKMVARQAARIARDLAGAAREYAAAGGGSHQFTPPSPTEAGTPPAGSLTEAGTSPAGETASAATPDQLGVRRQEGDQFEADQKFVAEVRNVLAQVKAMLAKQRRRSEQQHGLDPAFGRLEDAVANAVVSVNDAVAAIQSPPIAAGINVRV